MLRRNTQSNTHIERARGYLMLAYGEMANSLGEEFTEEGWSHLELDLKAEAGKIAEVVAMGLDKVTLEHLKVIGKWTVATEALLKNESWQNAENELWIEITEALGCSGCETVANVVCALASVGQLPKDIGAHVRRSVENLLRGKAGKGDIRKEYVMRILARQARSKGEQLALLDLLDQNSSLSGECVIQWTAAKYELPTEVVRRLVDNLDRWIQDISVSVSVVKTIVGRARQGGYDREAIMGKFSAIDLKLIADGWIYKNDALPEDGWILMEVLGMDHYVWRDKQKPVVQGAFALLSKAEQAHCLSRASGEMAGWLFGALGAVIEPSDRTI